MSEPTQTTWASGKEHDLMADLRAAANRIKNSPEQPVAPMDVDPKEQAILDRAMLIEYVAREAKGIAW